MKVLLTGVGGFLGWHTRLRLHARTDHVVVPVTRHVWPDLGQLCRGVNAVVHIAGVNRGEDAEVEHENIRLADDLRAAIVAEGRPMRVVYANSVHVGNGTAYGRGKAEAGRRLRDATLATGGYFVDVRLPNLFGEHGRPHYNSFVANFVHCATVGESPTIVDNKVDLLHAQQAAEALIDGLGTAESQLEPGGRPSGVREIWNLLCEFRESYERGEIPDLSDRFRTDLFNTYRSALFPKRYPIILSPHIDPRGAFVESVRCRGGGGQTSFSTTAPGYTRGEHYHLRKVERFVVMQGEATISLRKMFSNQILDFRVSGAQPTAIDMPVGWAHSITNTGKSVLCTEFWSNEVFRSGDSDTYREPVFPSSPEQDGSH